MGPAHLRVLSILLAALFVLSVTPLAVGHPPKGDHTSLTWANDEIWELLAPRETTNANENAHQPFYLIPHLDPDHGAHFGGFDQVVDPPPGNKGRYNANWHVFVLNNATADLNDDGTVECDPAAGVMDECLTSVAKIEQALDQGLAERFDTGFAFICPVRPH